MNYNSCVIKWKNQLLRQILLSSYTREGTLDSRDMSCQLSELLAVHYSGWLHSHLAFCWAKVWSQTGHMSKSITWFHWHFCWAKTSMFWLSESLR